MLLAHYDPPFLWGSWWGPAPIYAGLAGIGRRIVGVADVIFLPEPNCSLGNANASPRELGEQYFLKRKVVLSRQRYQLTVIMDINLPEKNDARERDK
ncbi:hypothetical protein WI664_16470 [Vibrio cholerae]